MNPAISAFSALDTRLLTHCRWLVLQQFELPVRIGIHAHERLVPQRMWFDVALGVRLDHAPAQVDHIDATLNYDFLREVIAQKVGHKHHELQETLCDAVLQELLAHPQVQAVHVATRKPDAYADCYAVGTERLAVKPW
jgi:dihydroneopterin aldolase